MFLFDREQNHISPGYKLQTKCNLLGAGHPKREVRRDMLNDRSGPPGIKDELVGASNKGHHLFVFGTFCASTQSPINIQVISIFLRHCLGASADRMLPRSSRLRIFAKV